MDDDIYNDISVMKKQDYNTFSENGDNHNPKSKIKAYTLMLMFAFSLIHLSANCIGLYVGIAYNNTTYYEFKSTMTLSTWLMTTTSIDIVGIMIVVFFSLIQYFYGIENTVFYSNVPLAMHLVMFYCVYVLMTIMGIIELSFKFKSYDNQLHYVIVMTIIIIVINLLTIVFSFTLTSIEGIFFKFFKK